MALKPTDTVNTPSMVPTMWNWPSRSTADPKKLAANALSR